jgi:protein-S-isoprenylcysteine O-methyltransferase Ste14
MTMLKPLFFFVYALVAYVLAMLTIVYFVGFLSGIGVPKTLNDGPSGPIWLAIVIDLALIALFGWHHSATARRRFKARWTRIVSPTIERATYLLMTVAVSAFLIGFWRPIPVTLWEVEAQGAVWAIRVAFLLVVLAMVLTTFQLGHFRFFGLAQAWERLVRRKPGRHPFCARWLFALVRHPISLGWMLLPWLVPHMTVGQALFGIGIACYILVATPFEEADLEKELGETYRAYRARVGAFLPRPRKLVPDLMPRNDDIL